MQYLRPRSYGTELCASCMRRRCYVGFLSPTTSEHDHVKKTYRYGPLVGGLRGLPLLDPHETEPLTQLEIGEEVGNLLRQAYIYQGNEVGAASINCLVLSEMVRLVDPHSTTCGTVDLRKVLVLSEHSYPAFFTMFVVAWR